MSFPTKTQLPVASNSFSKHKLHYPHVTTTDFLQFSVAFAQELVPNQSIQVKHDIFTRLEPLEVPTFGFARIISRAFWVPFRTIMPSWNDFITDTPHAFNNGSVGLVANVPLVSNEVLVKFLVTFSTRVEAVADIQNGIYDFGVCQSDGVVWYYKMSHRARFAYKLFRALGYAPILDLRVTSSYSALPLLAAAKVFVDWYYPSAYANSQYQDLVSSLFTRNNPITASTFLTLVDVENIFVVLEKISYDSDYFTSAWDNPSGPNDNLSSPFVIRDVTNENTNRTSTVRSDVGYANGTLNNTPTVGPTTNTVNNITQYMLDALHSLSDYLKRHQIVGSRALERYLSRFNVKLSSEKLNRSVHVNSYSINVQFGDVTSMADTATSDGAPLGGYAGKGLGYGKTSYSFDTNGEFGIFLIITTIHPEAPTFQGINRQVMHLTKLDFFTPEFDNLGVQAQSSSELYVPLNNPEHLNELVGYDEKVFGFQPRYAEYKTDRALVTGDYVLNTRNVGKDAWYLFRDMSQYSDSLSDYVHSYNFVTTGDKSQYGRIFQFDDGETDHFNLIHDIHIVSNFPGKPLYDDYEFEDEDKSNNVTVDVGGVTLN